MSNSSEMLNSWKHSITGALWVQYYGLEIHTFPCTLVILPPLKLAKRLSERVSTLALRWMVNLFEAVTIFLHLRETNIRLVSWQKDKEIKRGRDRWLTRLLNCSCLQNKLTWCICRRFLHPAVLAWQTAPEPWRHWEQSARKDKEIWALLRSTFKSLDFPDWLHIHMKTKTSNPEVTTMNYLNFQRNIQKRVKCIRDCFAV